TAHELTGPTHLPPDEVLTREQVLRRLRYLATVEHGLMVEYLYAYYSLAAPRKRPETAGPEQALYDAARVVLGVAIDEMRHFRWANEMLRELGEPAELGRVVTFDDFDDSERTFGHTFSLQPLTWERLDWFIEVEKPSREVDPSRRPGSVDGLYTRLLLSIGQNQAFTETERHQLQYLVKLIIDEGHDHYLRFSRVKEMLKGLDLPSRLRLPADPQPVPEGHPVHAYQQVADSCYAVVLTTLRFVFEQGGTRIGEMLNAARHAMYALDDAAQAAAVTGGAPLFRLPAQPPAAAPQVRLATAPGAGAPTFDSLIDPLVERALEPLAATQDGRALGERLRTRYAALTAAMHSLA
ncbi:MAG TPA: ferritin-like domain-containing protein, partial [Arenibaculum sp.]|nr:ferritin-like domain-containing protein [Arenibaculum sp.]